MRSTIRLATGFVLLANSFYLCQPLMADVTFNAPRVNREPGWAGPALLSPEQKEANKDIPILERQYRPGHVYGNMMRRHHYRDTIIPSHRDRVEMLETLRTKQPTNGKYVKDKYR